MCIRDRCQSGTGFASCGVAVKAEEHFLGVLAFRKKTVKGFSRNGENIKAILQGADLGMEHVVKTTVLLADIADFGAMNAVYDGFHYRLRHDVEYHCAVCRQDS